MIEHVPCWSMFRVLLFFYILISLLLVVVVCCHETTLLHKMDLKPQISWLKCSTLWKLISGHCPLYNTTGQLRTLHTIEGFEHGHMQQWPLTSPSLFPSYQRVGSPTGWIKATNTNKHMHYNMPTTLMGKEKKKVYQWPACIQATACWLSIISMSVSFLPAWVDRYHRQ